MRLTKGCNIQTSSVSHDFTHICLVNCPVAVDTAVDCPVLRLSACRGCRSQVVALSTRNMSYCCARKAPALSCWAVALKKNDWQAGRADCDRERAETVAPQENGLGNLERERRDMAERPFVH